jgi:flagellar basal body-associated protein FliL
MRIPWVGHVALFMRNSNGIIVILILIMVLIIIEFALPPALGKKPADEQEKRDEKAPEPEVSTSHLSTR